jgi:hypothetical protein
MSIGTQWPTSVGGEACVRCDLRKIRPSRIDTQVFYIIKCFFPADDISLFFTSVIKDEIAPLSLQRHIRSAKLQS